MKTILFLLMAATMFGCASYYNHVIEADYSYNGNFARYKKFDFVVDKNFEGTEEHKDLIEKFLQQNLQAWGYEKQAKKPDLYVFYRLYYEDFKISTYTQPDFEHWISQKFSSVALAENAEDSLSQQQWNEESRIRLAEQYDPIKCDLREGTLLISFYDRKQRKTVWQGYASGVFGNDRFDNRRFIQHIIHRILDKYRVLAYSS
ncbi:MAG: DUF4136 domain-containing protein [Cyclobacteriaceae bacterium]|nr:DUF4136 domain-containing protein [Cyclobacteriaceae bacterium HetDA_MAG_MS6]